MNRPAQQVNQPTPEQIQAQVSQAKIVSGLKTGLEFLNDGSVNGPIMYAEGIADLKWLLRGLLSGQFSLNLDPGSGPPRDQVKGRPLDEYDESPGGSSAGPNNGGADES